MTPNFEQMAKNIMIGRFGSEDKAIHAMRKMAGNHPVLKNAVSLFEEHDYQGLQNLGENLFKENYMDPQSMAQNFMNRFTGGMK